MLRKIAQFFKKIWGFFPLTLAGIIVALASLALRHYYAVARQDFLIRIISTGLFVLLAFSLVQTLINILIYVFTYKNSQLQNIQGHTGKFFQTGFKLKRYFFTPTLEAGVRWIHPVHVDAEFNKRWNTLHEKIYVRRRIFTDHVTREVLFKDLLGLSKFRHQFTLPQNVVIRPDGGKLQSSPPIKLFSSGDEISHPEGDPIGDLIEMKRYEKGDPVNRILWKTYAKTRKLLIRMPERSIAHKKKTYAYLLTGQDDEAAAATAWIALERGYLGDNFVFNTDGGFEPTNNVKDAKDQIVYSANSKIQADNLENFFKENLDSNKSNCIIFAPPNLGTWTKTLAQLGKRHQQNMQVLVSVDEYQDKKISGKIKRLFMKAPDRVRKNTQNAKNILSQLKGSGLKVLLLDQSHGTVIPEHHIKF